MRRYVCIISLLAVIFAPQVMLSQSKEMTSGKLYLRDQELDKAIYWFQEAIKLKPENWEAHFFLAQALGKSGKLPEMGKELESALSLLGKHETNAKKRAKQEEEIKKYRDFYYGETFNTGVKHAQANDWTKAAESFQAAHAIDPAKTDALKNLGYVYIRTENDSMAMVAYQELVKLNANDIDALNTLGNLYINRQDYENAIQSYQKTLAVDSTNVFATKEIAMSYDHLGQRDKAMAAYMNALRAKPDDKDLRYNYGRLFLLQEDYEKALEQFSMVLSMDPNDMEANVASGLAYLKIADRSGKAISDLEAKGLKITKGETKQLEALIAEYKSISAKAIPLLEKAVEIAPTNTSAWYNLGVAYTRTGDKEKGYQAIQKSEELAGK
jgi:Flp pilus assembly protein TadD